MKSWSSVVAFNLSSSLQSVSVRLALVFTKAAKCFGRRATVLPSSRPLRQCVSASSLLSASPDFHMSVSFRTRATQWLICCFDVKLNFTDSVPHVVSVLEDGREPCCFLFIFGRNVLGWNFHPLFVIVGSLLCYPHLLRKEHRRHFCWEQNVSIAYLIGSSRFRFFR